VLGSVVLVVCVLVAAVALTARQLSPPAIAEFAPQAVEQIKHALNDQSPDLSPGDLSPTPTASPRPGQSPTPGASASPGAPKDIQVPRVRQCIGSPARQTEDPQSPPCVPYFDPKLDNGGATAQGVTRDEITVAMPQQFLEDTTIAPKLVAYFNKRFELYGRKLVLRQFTASGCADNVPSPEKQRADAVAVQEEFKAFASLAYCNANSADRAYYDTLATSSPGPRAHTPLTRPTSGTSRPG
jgi:hypothetical protein